MRLFIETNEIIEDTFAFRDGRKSKEAEESIGTRTHIAVIVLWFHFFTKETHV